MPSTVKLPSHTFFLGRLSSLKWLTSTHSFTRNQQLPFLNEWKGENDHRKYFMVNLHKRMLQELTGIEQATSIMITSWTHICLKECLIWGYVQTFAVSSLILRFLVEFCSVLRSSMSFFSPSFSPPDFCKCHVKKGI